MVSIILYVFYNFDLRLQLENRLFDLRTRIKPELQDASNIVLITLDHQDIKLLEDPLARRVSSTTLRKLGQILRRSGCRATAIILPHQDFDYRSYYMKTLVNWAKTPNVYLGIFDYHRKVPSEKTPGSTSSRQSSGLWSSTTRRYRQEVLRSLPLVYYLGRDLKPALWTRIALDHSHSRQRESIDRFAAGEQDDYRSLLATRWSHSDEFPSLPELHLELPESIAVSAAQSPRLNPKRDDTLRDKIALVGYTAFRSRSISHRDGTFVNTPWNGDTNPEADSTPLLYAQATALHNLLKGQWLTPSPLWVNLVQTLSVSVASVLIWSVPSYLATLLFTGMMLLLLGLHSLVMAFGNFLIPLADTLLFAVLATIGGALWRAQRDTKRRLDKELSVESQKQIATVQARFLDRFAEELFTINAKITGLLRRHQNQEQPSETVQKTLTMRLLAVRSCRST